MRIPFLNFEEDLRNSTNSTTLDLYYIDYSIAVAEYIFVIVFFMILPFYMHVFKSNRERDQNTPIFVVVEHYYSMMWKFGIGYAYFFVAFFFLINQDGMKGGLIFTTIAICIVVACFLMGTLIEDVNQLMLSLLATQRFSLYFFPNSEKFWSFSGKTMKSITWGTYGLVLFVSVILTLIDSDNGVYHFIYYMAINTICIVSALLYIPVFWNIRKFAHLASAQLNHPQRYVLWQLVALALAKCTMIPAVYFVSEIGFFPTMSVCKTWNVSLTPIVMQLTYLGCNRRNVQELWNAFKSRKLLQIVCCPCKSSTKVATGGRQVNLEMGTM